MQSVIKQMGKRILTAIMAWGAMFLAYGQSPLALSELLFQPQTGEAEYLELYNTGSSSVELADYHIVRVLHDTLSTHYPLPHFTLESHTYVVLTRDASSVSGCFHVAYPSHLLECNLPTYPNSGGSVVLCTVDSTVVQRFDYSPSMHSRLLRDKAGVALERRDFDRPVNDPTNWFSAASTAGYGTPTSPNSQSTEHLAEESSFEFSSDIVSPDGDGYQDRLEISYRLEMSGLAARAEIYDVRGNMVRRLLNGDLLGTSGSIVWDGMADGGSRLPMGQYLFQIVLYDTSGTQQRIRRAVAIVEL